MRSGPARPGRSQEKTIDANALGARRRVERTAWRRDRTYHSRLAFDGIPRKCTPGDDRSGHQVAGGGARDPGSAASSTLPRRYLKGVAISPDGRTIATAALRRQRRRPPLGRCDHTERIDRYRDTAAGVNTIALQPRWTQLATGGNDGNVRFVEPRAHEAQQIGSSRTGTATGSAFSPDGRMLAVAGTRRRTPRNASGARTARRSLGRWRRGATAQAVAFSPAAASSPTGDRTRSALEPAVPIGARHASSIPGSQRGGVQQHRPQARGRRRGW